MDPDASARLRFPRSRHLRLGRDFARARNQGQRVTCGCLIANWVGNKADSPSRLGVVTARKVGNAVERSRARRLLRESFRLHQHDFERSVDLVLVARPSIQGKKFVEVDKDFLEAMRRARLLKIK